jgi:phosphoribosylanthranilate isomerase
VKIWVKICGVARAEDAEVAIAAGADAIGVNFSPASPRFCSAAAARAIVEAVAGRVVVYGLFVDESRERIRTVVGDTGVSGIQLHGNEPEELAHGWDLPLIRAIRVGVRDEVRRTLETARGYRVLLDSPRGGGSGTPFDAGLVEGMDLSEVVVAGGLTPANVSERIRRLRPWGVDVSSGVETRPAVKDPSRVREFVSNAKSAR